MIKNIKSIVTLCIMLSVTSTIYAQTARVGVNTADPKSTFDINGQKDADGKLLATDMTGLQAPRLTRAELAAKGDDLYGLDQKGTQIYISDITGGDNLSQRVNITSVGYYYFDGSLWLKFIDTDTSKTPTGFERLPEMSDAVTDFHWKLIGASPTAAGKYSLDATWIPKDLTETVNFWTELEPQPVSYENALIIAAVDEAKLGALGKNSFAAGVLNSSSGDASTTLGIGNEATLIGTIAAGAGNKSTGVYALGLGYKNLSAGVTSIAIGNTNEATGSNASAIGIGNSASGENSLAMGQTNQVSATVGVALGNDNKVTGSLGGVAIGQENQSSGQASVGIGTKNRSAGNNSVALGQENAPNGQASLAFGNGNTVVAAATSGIAIGTSLITSSQNATSMGRFNAIEDLTAPASQRQLFVVGNGGAAASRNNALTILADGKTGIGVSFLEKTTSTARLQVNGDIRIIPKTLTSACNANNEGSIQYVKTGNVGSFQGCTQTAASTYAWVQLNN